MHPSLTVPAAGSYALDPAGTKITFATTHVWGAPVAGSFALLHGEVEVTEPPEATVVRASVDATSINTGLRIRDSQLRAKPFLDTSRHPVLTFTSSALSQEPDALTFPGTLTVLGIESSVTVRVEAITFGGAGFTARGQARIDTRDFGLPSIPGLLGRSIDCTFDIDARQKPTDAP